MEDLRRKDADRENGQYITSTNEDNVPRTRTWRHKTPQLGDMLTLEGALAILEQSPELPSVDTFVYGLQQCRITKNAAYSKRVHLLIHKSGLEAHNALGNYLVPVLVDCGCVHIAQQVFRRLSHRNEHSWTSLIQGFSECEETSPYALRLFQEMQDESEGATSYTYLALIKACIQLCLAEMGFQLHGEIAKEGLEGDPYVGSALVDMYARFGSLLEAQDVFDGLVVRDVVLWTALVTQYVEHGFPEEAFDCLTKMQHDGVALDGVMCVCILKACRSIGDLDKGHEIHNIIAEEGFEEDPFVGNSLVDMYAKCTCLSEAWEVLESLPARDAVSWNSLITSYAELGLEEEVLTCLERMQIEGVSASSVTFVCGLQAFGIMKDGENAQVMHIEITKKGIEMDTTIGNSLVDTYSKCGLLTEAQKVFGSLSARDVVSWTALLGGYSEYGLYEKALECLEQMRLEDVSMDGVTLICILKVCSSMGAIYSGLKLHAYVAKEGFEGDPAVGNTLVDMYAKCNLLIEAQETFDNLHGQSVVSWNALLAGYVEQGLGDEVLDCLEELTSRRVCLNDVTYVFGLRGCASIGDLGSGQSLHMEIMKKGFDSELLVSTALVDLYAKCGSLVEADEVFDKLPEQSVVAWAALLAGYVEHGFCLEALKCIEQMKLCGVYPNALIYLCGLKACGKLKGLGRGQEIHTDIIVEEFDRDPLVGITLVNMYAKCGSSIEAQELFDLLTVRNIIAWNALITGYSDYGFYEAVLENLARMECEGVFPDAVTFTCFLKACTWTSSLSCGKLLHSQIVKDCLEVEPSVCSALMDMYAKFGSFQDVEEVFDELPSKTTHMWNTLLACYDEYGLAEDVLNSFEKMQFSGVSANGTTYACCLKACTRIGAVGKGQQLHAKLIEEGFENDPLVSNTVVDMYSKCGSFEEAEDTLAEQPVQDTLLWNALLSGYTKHGLSEAVLEVLEQMHLEDVSLDVVTLVSGLKACGDLGAVDKARELHTIIVKEEFEREVIVGNTLVDVYAKCGLLVEAQEVFDDLVVQDVVSWSALISGYACQGEHTLALRLLERMREEGIEPDEVTYLRLISACSHAGLVKMGQALFESIDKMYSMAVTVEQFNCMMDLLSRAGQLDEAIAMTEKIPCAPDMVTWTTMLGACRKWGNLELGRQAFHGIARLDKTESASFVLMSNIYADA